MNYFEAARFYNLLNPETSQTISSILGSEAKYVVTWGYEKRFANCEKGLVNYIISEKHKIRDFRKNTWDVVAIATKPIYVSMDNNVIVKELYPTIRLSAFFDTKSLSRTTLCMSAVNTVRDLGAQNFWQGI